MKEFIINMVKTIVWMAISIVVMVVLYELAWNNMNGGDPESFFYLVVGAITVVNDAVVVHRIWKK